MCKQSGIHEGRLKKCSNWGIRKERVEGEVLDRIRQLAIAPQEVAAALPQEADPEDEDQRRLRQLRAELAALRRRQQNLIPTIERAPDLEDALLDRVRELANKQRRLQQEIDRLEAQSQNRRQPERRRRCGRVYLREPGDVREQARHLIETRQLGDRVIERDVLDFDTLVLENP